MIELPRRARGEQDGEPTPPTRWRRSAKYVSTGRAFPGARPRRPRRSLAQARLRLRAEVDELFIGSGFLGHGRQLARVHPRTAARALRAQGQRSSPRAIKCRAPAALISSVKVTVVGEPSTWTGSKIGATSRDENGARAGTPIRGGHPRAATGADARYFPLIEYQRNASSESRIPRTPYR